MPPIILTADELRAMTQEAQKGGAPSPKELVEDWLHWVAKRGERFLTSAARFGYTEATLDLPYQLARQINTDLFRQLSRGLRDMIPGSKIFIVEEEYEGATLYKVEVSWAS